MSLNGDDYHKIDMIKKRTASNLGIFSSFYAKSVTAITSFGAVLFVALWVSVSLLGGCSKTPDDETLIRQAMKNIEKAAEQKKTGDILEYLAEDFMGNGTFRKANIKGMLFLHFQRHKNVHVLLRISSVKANGKQAEVECEVILAGRGEKIVPERARILAISSTWQKRDGNWLIVKADWEDPFYP